LFDVKLTPELPGIAWRCVRAYRRLLQRGRFTQPATGLRLERAIREQADPILKFMNERLEVDFKGSGVPMFIIRHSFDDWCRENDRLDLMRMKDNVLMRKINNSWGQVKDLRPHGRSTKLYQLKERTSGNAV
jgi:phage/plasmid-associated DNA primase